MQFPSNGIVRCTRLAFACRDNRRVIFANWEIDMRTYKLAVASIAAIALNGISQAAPHEIVTCPVDVRAEVTSPLPADWVATAQSSGPVSNSVEQIGGQAALVCNYRMFGTNYIVWRRPPSGWERCLAARNGTMTFACYRP